MKKPRVLVSGFVVRRPVGGLAWHYLHYVVGLARLGYDVYYIEDSEDYPCCFNPAKRIDQNGADPNYVPATFDRLGIDPTFGLNFAGSVFARLGLANRWAYYDAHSFAWKGGCGDAIKRVIDSADLFLNVSHSITSLRPWHLQIPARALVDTDPVFAQVRHIHVPAWLDRPLQHTAFLTFGENYEAKCCTTPVDGLPWRPTRQPIVLDLWPVTPPPSDGHFTTVMSWKSYDSARDGSVTYGVKSDSFQEYLDLAQEVPTPLELAVDGPAAIRQLLTDKGWLLRDALEVTSDPWTYQEYIRRSAGEFALAKQAYAVTFSGWFSERSAAYLASGRPVVAQETGFTKWMKSGRGVIPFKTRREARRALLQVMQNYKAHSAAAREIARKYFDHSRVLPRLIEEALSPPPVDYSHLAGAKGHQTYQKRMAAIRAFVPRGEAFILVDDNRLGVYGVLAGRKCLPFLERNGLYWGKPADDAVAIREIERSALSGTKFVVFAEPAFWWLDHYRGFLCHLESKYTCVLRDKHLVIFDLQCR